MKTKYILNPHLLVAMFGIASMATQAATVIDDFSGDLSAYTSTVILDANGGASNTAAWQISGGGLQLNTTVYDGIQQYAFIYNNLTLQVGQEVQADFSISGNQDFGLYVGNTVPTAGVRSDYVNIYVRGISGQVGAVYTRGFNGTSEMTLQSGGVPTFDKLFIAYTALNTYELGYYNGETRSVVFTRTTTNNDAGAVGFYADVRASGTLARADNLTVIPEPSAALLGGLGILGLLRRRRI